MKELNLSEVVKNVSGEEIKDQSGKALTFGHLLAQTLVSSNGKGGDPIKFFDWALTLYKGDPIMVDASDLNTIKDFVTSVESLTVLAKAPILKKIAALK